MSEHGTAGPLSLRSTPPCLLSPFVPRGCLKDYRSVGRPQAAEDGVVCVVHDDHRVVKAFRGTYYMRACVIIVRQDPGFLPWLEVFGGARSGVYHHYRFKPDEMAGKRRFFGGWVADNSLATRFRQPRHQTRPQMGSRDGTAIE